MDTKTFEKTENLHDVVQKGQLIVPKDNQIALRHAKYKVNYLVELDAESSPGQVVVHYIFDDTVEITHKQKEEIAAETRELICESFRIEMEADDDIKNSG